MNDLHDVEARLRGHPLVHGIDRTPRGHLRVETAFLYPDGASIDLFVVQQGALVPALRLSDLGQTLAWLLDVQVKPWLSKKRQGLLDDVLRLYGIEQRGAELSVAVHSADALMGSVLALGQACVRVSDLMFTKRSVLTMPFAEQLEDLLSDLEYPYVQNAELDGRYGKGVRVDFLVNGPRLQSAMLGLSSGTAAQAHLAATEVFRRWFDLDGPRRTVQRVTVYDDSMDVYREEDLRRLRELSELVAVSDRRSLAELLAA